MRIVTADRARRWRPRVDASTRRAARHERLGLIATSLVLTFGLWLTYREQQVGLEATLAGLAKGTIVNLATLKNGDALVPVLSMFAQPAERVAVASALYARAAHDRAPLEHVGGLARVTLPAASVPRNQRLAVLNERLRVRDASPVPVLTAADISALKPAVVVRAPAQHRRALLIAIGVFMLAFWLTHLVRGGLGLTGDPLLLPVVHLLTGLGLMTMVALRDPLRDTLAFATVSAGVAIACVVWVGVSFIDFERPRLRRAVVAPLAVAIALALALLVLGGGPTGSDAKVNLFGFQPVELIRPLFIFSLAAYFAKRWSFLRELTDTPRGRIASVPLRLPRWRDVRPLAISLGALLAFSFLQKDLGPALVLSCIFLCLFCLARAQSGLAIVGAAALVGGLWVGYVLGVPSTVARRVAIWLDPWENALQGGDQVAHGLWALSTGGLGGLGMGVGDPQLIPAGHTDLVIAALGEELGFIGVVAVAVLLALLTWRILRNALRAPGDYTAFLTFGFAWALVLQTLVIVGGTLGVLPLTGVVAPFLSFGRSSMISNIAAVAICAAVSQRRGAVRVHLAPQARAIGWTLAALGVLVLGRAAMVQGVRADALAARANLTQQADGGFRYQYHPRLVAAGRGIRRGTIYDRHGLPLATSRLEEVHAFARQYRELGLTLPRDCDTDATRCYPLGGLAFHVIGDAARQTNWAARNTSFVEQDLDARLKGYDDHPKAIEVVNPRTQKTYTVIRRDYAELLPLVRHKRNPSHPDVMRLLNRDRDVRLTLDARLQVRVARALLARTDAAGAQAGAAVVLDPASGALLASASYPWPETNDAEPRPAPATLTAQLLDRARYGLYPPGSTFKLVTAVAALRSPRRDEHSTLMCARLPDGRVGGHVSGVSRPIRDDVADHQPHGLVDLHRALVVSCNPYFAQLAQHVGARALADTAAAAQIALAPKASTARLNRTLPYAGYGQGDVLASPLRMTGVAAALADDGMLRPIVIATTPAESHAPAVRWLDADAAARLRGYMREVVTGGTGRVLSGHPVAIAGKTGTAEVDDAPSHSWFVGYAPHGSARKKIAFSVIIENAGYGARNAAPLAGDIVTSAQALGLFR